MREVLFCNASILTLSDPPEAQALLCRNGQVVCVGTLPQARSAARSVPQEIDLGGRRVIPAFVDGHSHLTAYAQTQLLCDLSSAESFEDLRRLLTDFARAHVFLAGQWLLAFGYDHTHLQEGRHPDASWLDELFPATPVLLTHASGHMGVVNSLGLQALGVTRDTPDPEGGRIGHDAAGQLTGYLEEAAFQQYSARIPKPDLEDTLAALAHAQELYAAQGIVTTQDALVRRGDWGLLSAAAQRGLLKLDTPCYLDVMSFPAGPEELGDRWQQYDGHLRAAGYKLFLDGSPQGKTAWLSQPYEGETSYFGYPVHSDEEVREAVRRAIAQKRQLVTHCNGDAAIDQLLRICEEQPEAVRPLRFVVIHAQCLRPDQLPRLRALNMSVSFFIAHTWYWGDVHLRNLGPERAGRISPLRSTLNADVPASLHQDTPVIAPNMLESMACAMERITLSGQVLGPEERVGVLDALRTVTTAPAWQLFEENQKGKLAPGFRCDLAVLDTDILSASLQEIRRAKVLATYAAGEEVWRAKA